MNKFSIPAILIALAAVASIWYLWPNQNQNQSNNELPNYLMSFHACDTATTDCSNPKNHLTYVAQSENGEDWNVLPNWEPFYGSVPDIAVRSSTLYIFTAANGGTVTRYDLTKQEIISSERISIEGVVGFVDPAPIIDEDGNLVLFFLHCREGEESVNCFGPISSEQQASRSDHYIGSAIEVPGSDGAKFTLSEGDRLQTDQNGTDPDIFFDDSHYVLYVSSGSSVFVYGSDDLNGSYTTLNETMNGILTTVGGVPSAYFDQLTGLYHSFVHVPSGPPKKSIAVIKEAVHQDFSKRLEEESWTTVISGESIGLTKTTTIESPGILDLR